VKVLTYEFSGDGGWSKWDRPRHSSHGLRHFQHKRIICCDCGLAHDFEYVVIDGAVHYRLRVNNRSTAAARREARKR